MDQSKTPDRPERIVRVNRRALAIVVFAVVLVVPGVLGIRTLQDRLGRSTLLAEAKRQRDEAKRPDLALGYFNRYLELAPNDLEALDQRAALLANSARDRSSIDSAIKAHVFLLARAGDGPSRGATRKRLAELYIRSEQFRAAEQAARDHLRFEPNDVEGRRLLARSLEGAGRMGDARSLDAAVAEYEAAEALEPGDVESGERLAAIYFDKFGDKPKATRVVDALLRQNPRSVAARLARARFFTSVGDAQAASREVNAAIGINPKDAEARLAAADDATRRDDPVSARRHLEAIDPPRPDDLRIKVLRGQIELAESKTDDAIRDWRDGLALAGGGDLELTWRLAHVLLQLGRTREAAPLISQYRRLSGGDSPSPACRYLIGLALLKSGRTAEAIAEFESIRYKFDRGLEGLLFLAMGQAYDVSPDPARAAEAYQRATASPAAGAAPWLALARLQAADRPGDAVATLERGLTSVGPDGRLFAALAQALWRGQMALPKEKRNWDELGRLLDRGREVAPESIELLSIRAEVAAARGRPEDGLAIFEAETRRRPASAAPWLALAESLAGLGRGGEALARLDQAVAATGDQANYRVLRARIAWSLGDRKAAEAALDTATDRFPIEQKATLFRALGDLNLTRGDRDAARRAYLEWSAARPDSIDPHLALLKLAVDTGDDRSIDLAVEALKAIGGPSNLYWRVARAEALLRDREGQPPSPAMLDEAAALIAEIKSSTPRRPSGVLLEARLMQYRNRPEDAIRAYQKGVELGGGPLAIKPLALLFVKLGRPNDLAELRARLNGLPADVERAIAAATPRRAADEAEARKVFSRILSDPSSRPRARDRATKAAAPADAPAHLIRLAAALDLADGDPDAAAREIARLEVLKLDDPATLELKAKLLKARGKPAEAVTLLERAFETAGESTAALELGCGMVRLLAAMDEPAAAERMARKASRLGPAGSIVLAEWLASKERFDESSAAYDDASKDPKSSRAAVRSALAIASENRDKRWVDLADRLIDRALRNEPKDDELAYALASLRHLQGRLAEAVQGYDDLAARSPNNLVFLNNGAWILSEELSQPGEALARIERLALKAGTGPHTLDTRGVILIRLGQPARAIDDLEAAAKATPSGPICFHLARAYLAAGRRADAVKAFARADAAGLKPESLQPSERDEFARVAAAVR